MLCKIILIHKYRNLHVLLFFHAGRDSELHFSKFGKYFTFLYLWSLASLLLYKCISDIKYVPAHPHATWVEVHPVLLLLYLHTMGETSCIKYMVVMASQIKSNGIEIGLKSSKCSFLTIFCYESFHNKVLEVLSKDFHSW